MYKRQTYEWKNTGKKILISHGWSGRGTQLHKIAAILNKEGYHIVSFDAPAHGQSTGKKTNMLQWISSMKTLSNKFSEFDYLIGHSLGGMAAFKYVNEANNIKKIITIGSPDSMHEIFYNFTHSVGLSLKTSNQMISFFEKKYNLKVDNYSASHLVKNLNIKTLIIHDYDDNEVSITCADNIHKHHQNSTLIKTRGLGHRRILKDEMVINQIKSFIN